MADRVGQQIGNYRLIRLLGRGGFAEVYLGQHLRLNMQAAIKVLHTQLADEDVEHFQREAQTIAALLHPHIVRVLDFDVQNGVPFLVMDYAPNGTLRRRYPRGSIVPLTTIISYITQVAEALQYAHQKQVIHRDIKPENMLLDQRNTVVLTDFGIALLAQSSRSLSTQEVAGTAAYMAPEQFQGKPRLASDQYALGVVIYEWLSGEVPFHGSFSEIASQHLFISPPPVREKVPTIPPAVEQVVLIALEKDPHKRFASIQAFARALEEACQVGVSYPVTLPSENSMPRQSLPSSGNIAAASLSQSIPHTKSVTPPSQLLQPKEIATPSSGSLQATFETTPSYTAGVSSTQVRELALPNESQPSKRRISRRTVIVGMAGLAAVSVAGSSIAWLALSQSRQVPLGTTLLIYRGQPKGVEAVAWSPNGKRIASAEWGDNIQICDATTGGNVLTCQGWGSFAITWSPDSKRIASPSWDKVRVWDTTTGDNVLTYSGHNRPLVEAATWSPNGKYIASGAQDKTVQVWDATTGNNVMTYRGSQDQVNGIAWSPDGTRIASGSYDHTVQIWDPNTGNTIYIYRGYSGGLRTLSWSPDGKRIVCGGDWPPDIKPVIIFQAD